MTYYQCDMCKKLTSKQLNVITFLNNNKTKFALYDKPSYEICCSCFKKIHNFIKTYDSNEKYQKKLNKFITD